MRLIALIYLVFGMWSAGFGQHDDPVIEIVLSKVSRGYQEQICVKPDSIKVKKEDRKSRSGGVSNFERPITEMEWSAIAKMLESIHLKDVPQYQAPSFDRAGDAAAHSTIALKTKDGKEYAHMFDGDNPHKRLSQLVAAIHDLGHQK